MFKTPRSFAFWVFQPMRVLVLDFPVLSFEFVSDFVLRISDLDRRIDRLQRVDAHFVRRSLTYFLTTSAPITRRPSSPQVPPGPLAPSAALCTEGPRLRSCRSSCRLPRSRCRSSKRSVSNHSQSPKPRTPDDSQACRTGRRRTGSPRP